MERRGERGASTGSGAQGRRARATLCRLLGLGSGGLYGGMNVSERTDSTRAAGRTRARPTAQDERARG